MANYPLSVKNGSSPEGNIWVYQTGLDLADPAVMSLVWFSQQARQPTSLSFNWSIDYRFVWDERGGLEPSSTMKAINPVRLEAPRGGADTWVRDAFVRWTLSNREK